MDAGGVVGFGRGLIPHRLGGRRGRPARGGGIAGGGVEQREDRVEVHTIALGRRRGDVRGAGRDLGAGLDEVRMLANRQPALGAPVEDARVLVHGAVMDRGRKLLDRGELEFPPVGKADAVHRPVSLVALAPVSNQRANPQVVAWQCLLTVRAAGALHNARVGRWEPRFRVPRLQPIALPTPPESRRAFRETPHRAAAGRGASRRDRVARTGGIGRFRVNRVRGDPSGAGASGSRVNSSRASRGSVISARSTSRRFGSMPVTRQESNASPKEMRRGVAPASPEAGSPPASRSKTPRPARDSPRRGGAAPAAPRSTPSPRSRTRGDAPGRARASVAYRSPGSYRSPR